jgi:hypothetical protein
MAAAPTYGSTILFGIVHPATGVIRGVNDRMGVVIRETSKRWGLTSNIGVTPPTFGTPALGGNPMIEREFLVMGGATPADHTFTFPRGMTVVDLNARIDTMPHPTAGRMMNRNDFLVTHENGTQSYDFHLRLIDTSPTPRRLLSAPATLRIPKDAYDAAAPTQDIIDAAFAAATSTINTALAAGTFTGTNTTRDRDVLDAVRAATLPSGVTVAWGTGDGQAFNRTNATATQREASSE